MRVIAFDVMGGDLGLSAAINGALNFIKVYPDYHVILVGDQSAIAQVVDVAKHPQLSIEHAPRAVSSEASLAAARDRETSMAKALLLVRENKASAALSAGNSGVYLAAASINLVRLPDVSRPAFMTIIPTLDVARPFVLLDAGANLEVTAEILGQWARLGVAFVTTAFQRKSPTAALLNVGTEAEKGLAATRLAHQDLQKNLPNYIGFVEPRDLLVPAADVIVVDGYGGNLVLKTLEGTVLTILELLRQAIKQKRHYKLGALLARGAFRNVRERFDYRHIGAAWVLGLNGLVAKCHGASDELAFLSGLSLVRDAIEADTLATLTSALSLANEVNEV